MRQHLLLLAMLLLAAHPVAVGGAPFTAASIQEGMICVDPDVEFPVPCDEDED